MSSCSSALLDLLAEALLRVSAEVLFVGAKLPLEPAAAAKLKIRVRHNFLPLLLLSDEGDESKVRNDRLLEW